MKNVLAVFALALLAAGPLRAAEEAPPAAPDGLAIRAGKVLTMAGDVIDDGVILVRAGKIEAVGPASKLTVPDGYAVLDETRRWVMPGIVDIYNHAAAAPGRDINDMVYQVNPELRVLEVVAAESPAMEKALGGGVTTVLLIPGSGTNMSGFGVLVRTAADSPKDAIVRWPGVLKVAQAGNPERRAGDLGSGRMGMNWLIRNTFREAREYDRRWTEWEEGRAKAPPERDLRLEGIRKVVRGEVPVLVHTQWVPVIEATMRILHDEFGLTPVLSHATFDSFKAAPVIVERGLPVNTGPRGLFFDRDRRRIYGIAAEWYRRGVDRLSICTDAPVVPQEELILQAAVAVRLGLPARVALRAITIEPARAIGIADRVGSIEPGKDADLAIFTGDPLEMRHWVTKVLIRGKVVYDADRDGRRF